jgi:hypothetical protein
MTVTVESLMDRIEELARDQFNAGIRAAPPMRRRGEYDAAIKERKAELAAIKAEIRMLHRDVIQQLSAAMRESMENGCTEHLDCWDEAEQLWYGPLKRAEMLLGSEK